VENIKLLHVPICVVSPVKEIAPMGPSAHSGLCNKFTRYTSYHVGRLLLEVFSTVSLRASSC